MSDGTPGEDTTERPSSADGVTEEAAPGVVARVVEWGQGQWARTEALRERWKRSEAAR